MEFAIAAIVVFIVYETYHSIKGWFKKNPPPKRVFPTRHATHARDNVYVPGVGWCKPKDE